MAELIKLQLIAVRLMVSITDRGDDMSFPIIFIISVLPGTHCTTSDSALLSLLHSDNVYLWADILAQQHGKIIKIKFTHKLLDPALFTLPALPEIISGSFPVSLMLVMLMFPTCTLSMLRYQ